MATLITKNSSTASSVPTAAQLVQGELAVNVTDKRLFTENSSGIVVELGTNPSTLALPNGTANGVAYLNGSKVLTTGSALTFDGSSFGVGTTTPSQRIDSQIATTTEGSGLAVTNSQAGGYGSGLSFYSYRTDGTTKVMAGQVSMLGAASYADSANSTSSMLFKTISAGTLSEQMRLTSTGLGIGTSSPGYKLDTLLGAGSGNIFRAGQSGVSNGYTITTSGSALTHIWANGGSDAMRLDSSGNLGLGVTPSAWSSSYKVLQLNTQPAVWGSSDALFLTVNQFQNTSGSNRYIANGFATQYRQDGGQHQWYTAPSGTAGNAITFTQAMTLDASGNLGVGTTSPAYRLQVETASATGNIVGYFRQGSGAVASIISTTDLVGFGNGATAGETRIYADGSSGLVTFRTNSTERARITSGGYFKASNDGTYVGSTASYHELRVTGAAGDWNTIFANATATAANAYGIRVSYTGSAPNGTGNAFLNCDDTGATRFVARSNGGLANYSANDVNLSDRREKTNFAPAKSYLDTICAIPVQTFNYIDQSEDDPGLTLGVVAQDVQAVAPELVMESNWGTEDNPKMRLSIYQTDLQYALMKALQELKAEFDAYKATHP